MRLLQRKARWPDRARRTAPKPFRAVVKLLAILPFLFASGCNTVSKRAPVESFPASVILVTAGSPADCKAKVTHLRVYNRISRIPVDGVPNIPVETYVNDADSTTVASHGTVNAFRLQPGKYYLYPVLVNAPANSTPPTFGFEVKSGETVYIGEMFMTQSCHFTKRFVVNDEYDRDIKRAMDENPSLNTRTPIKRLLKTIVP
ncbi:MAG: hypothetical protein ABJA60_10170 [Nitrosospira sp.]